jgi:isocitrate lyase
MPGYLQMIDEVDSLRESQPTWGAINAEYVVRMKLQNRFTTGLEIAQHTADIMRRDMAGYDADPAKYTQSLGAWQPAASASANAAEPMAPLLFRVVTKNMISGVSFGVHAIDRERAPLVAGSRRRHATH